MSGNRQRLDTILVERGFAASRERAKALIMAGIVFVDNQKITKPGDTVDLNGEIRVTGADIRYVSRGGLKLEKALAAFAITLDGRVCMDIGASTGGFSDCMLQNGAPKVYAVDVGYGQLAWKLRTDPRVVNLERTNIRHLTAEQIGENISFASIDVSFISLVLVLPVAHKLLCQDGEVVCLVKPQFEAGKGKVGKKGVVREPEIHLEVVQRIADFAVHNGFLLLNADYSPIRGPEGNIEYLFHLRKSQQCEMTSEIDLEALVRRSHDGFGA
ncbi:MAG: TlyA family RNA methyltransferase [Acetanaerobacterium sp.]